MTFVSLVPVDSTVQGPPHLDPADRTHALDGATVGLMHNVKPNARELLTLISELLSERYPIRPVVGPVRTKHVMLPSDEQLDDMAAACDVVLVGLGDCSSCSSLSAHMAIDFERRGVPAVVVGTKPFEKAVEAMGRRHGYADIPFAKVEHPVSSLDTEGLRARAHEALPQILNGLGVPTSSSESALSGEVRAG